MNINYLHEQLREWGATAEELAANIKTALAQCGQSVPKFDSIYAETILNYAKRCDSVSFGSICQYLRAGGKRAADKSIQSSIDELVEKGHLSVNKNGYKYVDKDAVPTTYAPAFVSKYAASIYSFLLASEDGVASTKDIIKFLNINGYIGVTYLSIDASMKELRAKGVAIPLNDVANNWKLAGRWKEPVTAGVSTIAAAPHYTDINAVGAVTDYITTKINSGCNVTTQMVIDYMNDELHLYTSDARKRVMDQVINSGKIVTLRLDTVDESKVTGFTVMPYDLLNVPDLPASDSFQTKYAKHALDAITNYAKEVSYPFIALHIRDSVGSGATSADIIAAVDELIGKGLVRAVKDDLFTLVGAETETKDLLNVPDTPQNQRDPSEVIYSLLSDNPTKYFTIPEIITSTGIDRDTVKSCLKLFKNLDASLLESDPPLTGYTVRPLWHTSGSGSPQKVDLTKPTGSQVELVRELLVNQRWDIGGLVGMTKLDVTTVKACIDTLGGIVMAEKDARNYSNVIYTIAIPAHPAGKWNTETLSGKIIEELAVKPTTAAGLANALDVSMERVINGLKYLRDKHQVVKTNEKLGDQYVWKLLTSTNDDLNWSVHLQPNNDFTVVVTDPSIKPTISNELKENTAKQIVSVLSDSDYGRTRGYSASMLTTMLSKHAIPQTVVETVLKSMVENELLAQLNHDGATYRLPKPKPKHSVLNVITNPANIKALISANHVGKPKMQFAPHCADGQSVMFNVYTAMKSRNPLHGWSVIELVGACKAGGNNYATTLVQTMLNRLVESKYVNIKPHVLGVSIRYHVATADNVAYAMGEYAASTLDEIKAVVPDNDDEWVERTVFELVKSGKLKAKFSV